MENRVGLNDLRVYQSAMEVGERIWNLVSAWDSFEKWSLGKQFCEAADSIAANIAEGFGRYHYNENRNFCFYARGSLMETKTWLQKAHNRRLLSEEEFEGISSQLTSCHKQLNQYIKSIGQSSPGAVREAEFDYNVNPEHDSFSFPNDH